MAGVYHPFSGLIKQLHSSWQDREGLGPGGSHAVPGPRRHEQTLLLPRMPGTGAQAAVEHQCHVDGHWVPLPGAARHPQDHLHLTLCLLVLAEQFSRLRPGCPSVSGAAPSEPVVPRRSLLGLHAAVGVHWCA